MGWGVVQRSGTELRHIAHGAICLEGRDALPIRLQQIHQQLTGLIAQYRPQVASVESLFFYKDAQAAAKLGHARGVVLLCMAEAAVEVAEYAPARVKRTITGNGQAEKRQVSLMIRALLALGELPGPDESDALALAVTHLRIGPLLEAVNTPGAQAIVAALRRPSRRSRRASLRALLGR
jgi:crossover junction endodeoxyribonuclease RuvC